ncbi:hypothetical protein B0T22DRAFT_48725 [Podospora appendiculata]|uniref:Uncharacterized protein n=1 Tax=Podospora appendiculata TaxID=314037 RepID=A0AAE1CGI9_9PEZI|nr:hypothetical protein B0T22DRAFT_48725 [Podospora appendiculata]
MCQLGSIWLATCTPSCFPPWLESRANLYCVYLRPVQRGLIRTLWADAVHGWCLVVVVKGCLPDLFLPSLSDSASHMLRSGRFHACLGLGRNNAFFAPEVSKGRVVSLRPPPPPRSTSWAGIYIPYLWHLLFTVHCSLWLLLLLTFASSPFFFLPPPSLLLYYIPSINNYCYAEQIRITDCRLTSLQLPSSHLHLILPFYSNPSRRSIPASNIVARTQRGLFGTLYGPIRLLCIFCSPPILSLSSHYIYFISGECRVKRQTSIQSVIDRIYLASPNRYYLSLRRDLHTRRH